MTTTRFAIELADEAISLLGSMGPKPGPDSCTHNLRRMVADVSLADDVRSAASDGLTRFRAAEQEHFRRGRIARAVESALALRRSAGKPALLKPLTERCDAEGVTAMIDAGVIVIDGDRYDVAIWGYDAVEAAIRAARRN